MAIPNTFTNGTVADADDVMENLNYVNPIVHQVYTGTDLNVSTSGGTDENSLELTAITAADLANKQYIKISYLQQLANTTGVVGLYWKIQVKETGGAYADKLAEQLITNQIDTGNHQLIWYYTLTAGDLTNGCQVKIFVKATGAGTSGGSTVQLVQEVIGG